jgi:hypothetical protein
MLPQMIKVMKLKNNFLKIYKKYMTKYLDMILLGNMNTKIGWEDVYHPVSGIHTLHDISNKNG